MIQGVPNKVFHEILSEVHIIAKFVEGHFGFDHPEFGKMGGVLEFSALNVGPNV
jgi:hypothetical protein